VSFGYDEDGNLTSMADGTGTSTYEYDQLGRLVHSKDGNGETVGWEWDLGDEPVGLTYPNGKSITRAYDEDGRLEGLTDWLGHTISFAYNADSAPTATTFPVGTGDTDEYAYDRADRMSGVTMKKGAETLASLAYTRDPAGQVESLISKGLPGAETESFGYDENERLEKAGAAEYEYDAANNVTKAPGTTNAFDKASQLESSTGATFTYDKEGARIKETPSSGPVTTYKYDQAEGLTAIERTEEGETPAIAESFAYDGTGLLASRTVGLSTRHLVWDLTQSPELLLSDGEDSYVYGPNGLAVEQISSGEVPIYLHHDQLGSTRLLTDASGEVAGTFTYGPFGVLTGHTGSATTVLGYGGQYTLGQGALQYLRARFYDPPTAQFITPDPITSLTRAPYSYARGNPLANVDPSGYCGVESVGSFLESINPVSSENCAFQAAEDLHRATGIDLPGTLSQPAVVDATAVGVCVLPGTDIACGAGLAAAFGAASAGVVAEGTETNFCDVPHLLAEEGVNVLLLGFGGLGIETANLAGDAPLAAQGIIRGGPAVAQGVLDWVHGW
jgi:RHS repeat-associated protein